MSELRASVVVEWDNVRLAGASRARAMLERLSEELGADDRRALEVLLVHDGHPGDVEEARRALAPTGVDVRVVEPPPETDDVATTNRFFANSVAFRRETALAFPFPELAGSSRASCVVLAHRLAEAGVRVVASRSARAGHPAPAGVGRAFVRALVHGRDTVILVDAGVGDPATPRTAIRRLRNLLRSAVRDRRRLGLSPVTLPLATAIAVAYHGVAAAGALLARVTPDRARGLEL